MPFDVIPAIDLRGGHVVRLRRGDFDDETAYGSDPAVVALEFAAAGAQWLHVVDLDGARVGEPRNLTVIEGIVTVSTGRIRCEVAGGLRNAEATAEGAGPRRCARRDRHGRAARPGIRRRARPGSMAHSASRSRSTFAMAWRSGRAGAKGAPGVPADEAMARLADAGVVTFEVTAINRDGLLEGPGSRAPRPARRARAGRRDRLGRHLVAGRSAGGGRSWLRRRDRRAGALRGPDRPGRGHRDGRQRSDRPGQRAARRSGGGLDAC